MDPFSYIFDVAPYEAVDDDNFLPGLGLESPSFLGTLDNVETSVSRTLGVTSLSSLPAPSSYTLAARASPFHLLPISESPSLSSHRQPEPARAAGSLSSHYAAPHSAPAAPAASVAPAPAALPEAAVAHPEFSRLGGYAYSAFLAHRYAATYAAYAALPAYTPSSLSSHYVTYVDRSATAPRPVSAFPPDSSPTTLASSAEGPTLKRSRDASEDTSLAPSASAVASTPVTKKMRLEDKAKTEAEGKAKTEAENKAETEVKNIADTVDSILKQFGNISSHSVAAHFLGDAFITGVYLGAEALEGQSFETVLSFIHKILKEHGNLICDQRTIDQISQFIVQVIEIATYAAALLRKLPTDKEQSHAFAEWMIAKIKSLKSNQKLLIPGGWIGIDHTPGHSMLYELHRNEDSSFDFSIYNSGDGIRNHASHFMGLKQKYSPLLQQKKISLDTLARKEVWRGYFEYCYIKPKGFSHGEYDIYEGFLKNIHPNFGQDHCQGKAESYITPQRAGTCSADAFFAFMHSNLPKIMYKRLKYVIKHHALQEYFMFVQSGLSPADISRTTIRENSAVLDFLDAYVEKFARSVKKGLERNVLSVEEATNSQILIKDILFFIKNTKKNYAPLFAQASLKINFGLRDLSTISLFPSHPPVFETSQFFGKKLVDFNPQWLSPETCCSELAAWFKLAENCYLEEKDKPGTLLIIGQVFASMPLASAPYWNAIPAIEKEVCMELLVNLSNLFFKANLTNSVHSDTFFVEQICYMQKAFAIVKKISTVLPDDDIGIGKIKICTETLSHDLKNGQGQEYYLADPVLEYELTDTLSTLHLLTRASSSDREPGMFRPNLRDTPEATLDPQMIEEICKKTHANKNEWTREIAFIFKFLSDHPSVKAKISADLQKKLAPFAGEYSEDDSDIETLADHLIIAEALTDLEGKYLPRAFCALKHMTYLTHWFLTGIFLERVYDRADSEPFSGHVLGIKIEEDSLKHYISKPSCPITTQLQHEKIIRDLPTSLYSEKQDYYRCYHNYIAGSANQTIASRVSSYRNVDHLDFILLSNTFEKPQQIVKTITYFKKNLHEFCNLTQQTTCLQLILERGLLRIQLKDEPEVVHVITEFISTGYRYAMELHEISSMLFFIRLSSYTKQYCQHVFNADKKFLAEFSFPNHHQQLIEMFNQEEMTLQEKSLIAREFIALFGRERDYTMDWAVHFLRMAIFYADHLPEASFNNPYLSADMRQAHRAFALWVQSYQDPFGDEISRNFDPVFSAAANIPSSTWKYFEFPLVECSRYKLQIDLLEGKIYHMGFERSPLSHRLKTDPLFITLFSSPELLTETRANGPGKFMFKDQHGFNNRAYFLGQWHFQKEIKGEWCDYFSESNLINLPAESIRKDNFCWQVLKRAATLMPTLWFIDKKSGVIAYQYLFASKQLYCIDERSIRKGLILTDTSQSVEMYTVLRQFDPCALVWKSRQNVQCLIEMPRFGLLFTYDPKKNKIMAPLAHQGYYIAEQQLLYSLRRATGYLILQNDRGERHLLLAKHKISERNSTHISRFLCRIGKHYEDTHTYYTYQIDSKGRLTSNLLVARIYLAYIFLAQRNYRKAYALLHNNAVKLEGYSKDEAELLNQIAGFKNVNLDSHVRASAVRLTAEYLRTENEHTFQVFHFFPNSDDKSENAERTNLYTQDLLCYVEQISHIAVYALTPMQERLLLKGKKNEILRRRLSILTGKKSPKTPSPKDPDSAFKLMQGIVNPGVAGHGWEDHWARDKYFASDHGSVLDNFSSLVRPQRETFAHNFLHLYKIATAREKKNTDEYYALKAITTFNSYWHTNSPQQTTRHVERFAFILKCIMENPKIYPTISEMRKKMSQDKGSHSSRLKALKQLKVLTHREVSSKLPKPNLPHVTRTPLISLKAVPAAPFKAIIRKKSPKPISPLSEISTQTNLCTLLPASRLFAIESERKEALDRESMAIGPLPLFVKNPVDSELKAEMETKELSSLLTQLNELATLQTQRVEKRVLLELRDDVMAATKSPSAEEWLLHEAALPDFERDLSKLMSDCEGKLKETKSAILELANKLSLTPIEKVTQQLELHGKVKIPLTMADLMFLYVRGNAAEFKQRNPQLTEENIQTLVQEVENYLIHSTQLQQLQRIHLHLQGLKECRAKSLENEEMTKELSREILREVSAKRQYDPVKFPQFLLFEYKRGLLIREDQIGSLKKLFGHDRSIKNPNIILQMIMGSGKTEVLLPLLALHHADGQALSIIMAPEELMETLQETMQIRSGEIFQQQANRINWKQTKNLEGLQYIYTSLKTICSNREFLLATNKEIHQFMLEAMQARFDYQNAIEFRNKEEMTHSELVEAYRKRKAETKASSKKRSGKRTTKAKPVPAGSVENSRIASLKSELQMFTKIKTLLKEQGVVVMDEVDTLLKCRQETHRALGKEEKVNQNYVTIASMAYDLFLENPEISKRMNFDFSSAKTFGAEPYTPALYEEFKPMIANHLLIKLMEAFAELQHFCKDSPASILSYLLQAEEKGKPKVALPEEMSLDLKNALAFARSEIQIFLPVTLNKLYGIHYGFFPKKNSENNLFAGPFHGANKPNLGSQFGHTTEIINYTIQAYHKTGLPIELLKIEIDRMITSIKLEGIENFEERKAYQEYLKLVGPALAKKFPLFHLKGVKLKTLADAISKTPLLLNRFLRMYILPQITLYNKRISSNPQTLVDAFKIVKGFSGTFSEAETFHDSLNVLKEVGTDGKTVSLLWKNSRRSVNVLHTAENPLLILKEILAIDHFHAIIDAGALFKDIPAATIANELLLAKKNIEAVTYFDGDKRMVVKRGQIALPANQCEVHPSTCFTFYDQQHCTGTNIKQAPNAKAAVTINKNQTLRDILQAVWRMRGLALGQKVHFVLPNEVRDIISSMLGKGAAASLDVMDLLLYAGKKQAQEQAENNLVTIMQKFKNHVFQHCDNFLDQINSAFLREPLFIELNDQLLTTTEDSPYKQYGTIESLVAAESVLRTYRDQMLHHMSAWLEKYRAHALFKKIKTEINIAAMKEKMDETILNALVIGRERVAEVLPVNVDTLKALSIELAVNSQRDVAKNVNQDQRMTLHQNKLNQLNFSNLKEENSYAWQMHLNFFCEKFFTPIPFAESWAKEEFVDKDELIKCAPTDIANFILSAENAFLVQQNAFKKSLKGCFAENLFFSLNLIYTLKNKTPFCVGQKPIDACLIIQDKRKEDEITLLAIDGLDAVTFKEVLAKDRRRPQKAKRDTKICLFYLNLGIVQHGYERIDLEYLKKHTNFSEAIVQLKFISGEVACYPSEERTILRRWIGRHEDPKVFEEFFKTVLIRNSIIEKNYPSSLLASIFADEVSLKQERERKGAAASGVPDAPKPLSRVPLTMASGKTPSLRMKPSRSSLSSEPKPQFSLTFDDSDEDSINEDDLFSAWDDDDVAAVDETDPLFDENIAKDPPEDFARFLQSRGGGGMAPFGAARREWALQTAQRGEGKRESKSESKDPCDDDPDENLEL